MILKILLLCLFPVALFPKEIIIIDQNEPLKKFRALETLHASGSAQFSEQGLEELQQKLNQKNLVILDLRRESHGFINGEPVSWMDSKKPWTNVGLSSEQIQEKEKALLRVAAKEKKVTLFETEKEGVQVSYTPRQTEVKEVTTESNLAAKKGIGYKRLPVSDHKRPENAEVEEFLAFYKSLPQDSWLHIHCKGGGGRTSTLLTMIDMLHNAKRESFEEIMKRQNAINDKSLDVPQTPLANKFRAEFKERLLFLKKFYEFARTQS